MSFGQVVIIAVSCAIGVWLGQDCIIELPYGYKDGLYLLAFVGAGCVSVGYSAAILVLRFLGHGVLLMPLTGTVGASLVVDEVVKCQRK